MRRKAVFSRLREIMSGNEERCFRLTRRQRVAAVVCNQVSADVLNVTLEGHMHFDRFRVWPSSWLGILISGLTAFKLAAKTFKGMEFLSLNGICFPPMEFVFPRQNLFSLDEFCFPQQNLFSPKAQWNLCNMRLSMFHQLEHVSPVGRLIIFSGKNYSFCLAWEWK